MDVEGPLSKAFAIFAISFFGVTFVLAIIGLIIASRGVVLVPIIAFLMIFLVCFFLENKQEIFNRFKRGEK
ncbi:hypothetical protein ACT414_18525 (plasmid) [Acinetobacter baumannii]